MDKERLSRALLDIYHRLLVRYGPQHWWPAEGPFEMMVGAVLTQNTAWTNVAKAIDNLKAAGALSPGAMRRLPMDRLSSLVHPCGYYNVKAARLKALVDWLGEQYSDDLDRLFGNGVDSLRQQLLSVQGIGEETADSIILYAADKPVFVIDAYTRRILRRIGLAPGADGYRAYQDFFMDNLPADAELFNEYHALLVRLGKEACRQRPVCRGCCLSDICHYYLKEVGL